jgi:HEAT repeat protein
MKKRFPLLILLIIFLVGFWSWFQKVLVTQRERPVREEILLEIERRIDEIEEITKECVTHREVIRRAKPAIFQLTFIGTPGAEKLRRAACDKERHPLARVLYLEILAIIENTESIPAVIQLLKDKEENEMVRTQAAATLGMLKDERAVSALKEALFDESERVTKMSAAALLTMQRRDLIEEAKRKDPRLNTILSAVKPLE